MPHDVPEGGSGVPADSLLQYARSLLGVPYVFGGTDPKKGLDCSGFVQVVFHHVGIDLPRTSQDQARQGTPVQKGDIRPGDLVFTDWGDGPNSHVGIATSGGQIIDAPHSGSVVRYDALSPSYLDHVTAIRRISGVQSAPGITKGTVTEGGGDGGGFWGPIIQPFQDLTSAVGSIGKAADLITKAFLPSNAVRIISGLAGAVFILLGIWMLTREVRQA